MANASREWERLEARRLLSADVPAGVTEPAPEPDLPVVEYTSDVVIAAGRQQIYPPLAPAGWVDESVGSFEEPEAITVAFFAPDPVDDTPTADDEPIDAAPPPFDSSAGAEAPAMPKPSSIARELLAGEDDAALIG